MTGADVRVTAQDGNPWFVAKDVCDALGFSHTPSAIRALDEDEKGVLNTHTLGGTQEITIISESGLYSLILKSRKPEAKAFKKWVTGTVLPAIRNVLVASQNGTLGSWPRACAMRWGWKSEIL